MRKKKNRIESKQRIHQRLVIPQDKGREGTRINQTNQGKRNPICCMSSQAEEGRAGPSNSPSTDGPAAEDIMGGSERGWKLSEAKKQRGKGRKRKEPTNLAEVEAV